MEIITTTPAWFDGAPVDSGTVVDVPEADAAYLIGIGRAEHVTPAPSEAPAE